MIAATPTLAAYGLSVARLSLVAVVVAFPFLLMSSRVVAAAEPLIFYGDDNTPPYEFLDHGHPKGLNVDLLRAIGDRLGRPVEIRLTNWADAQAKVQEGFGHGLTMLASTPERRESWSFTEATHTLSFSLFMLSGEARLLRATPLAEQRIGVQAKAFSEQWFRTNRADVALLPSRDFVDGIRDLMEGRIDAFAQITASGMRVLELLSIGGIVVAPEPFVTREVSIPIRKSEVALLKQVDDVLLALKSDGTFDQITKRWSPSRLLVFSQREVWFFAATTVAVGATLVLLVVFFMVLAARRRQLISERNRSEEILRRNREDLDRAQAVAHTGSWRLDINHNELTWSAENHRIFGLPEGTPMSYETFLGIVHPDDREVVDREWKAGLAGEPYDIEHRILVDGQVKWVRERATLEFDGDRRLLGGFGTTQDITDRKKAEQALRESEGRLLHASRLSEIGRMAAALAHELNQPLTAVSSYIGGCRRILRAGVDDDGRKRRLQDVMEQANAQALRAGDIIRRLREFIGSADSERRIKNAASVMHEAFTLAIVAANHDGVSVRSNFKETGHILVDTIQIQQVVMNLVRNALEAMESAPRKALAIGLAVKHGHIEFSVSDTGSGIPPEIADRLFTPFSTTKGRGMGIGLSVCREIVEAHDGKIWAEPNADGGTVFRFVLPLVPDEMCAGE